MKYLSRWFPLVIIVMVCTIIVDIELWTMKVTDNHESIGYFESHGVPLLVIGWLFVIGFLSFFLFILIYTSIKKGINLNERKYFRYIFRIQLACFIPIILRVIFPVVIE